MIVSFVSIWIIGAGLSLDVYLMQGPYIIWRILICGEKDLK